MDYKPQLGDIFLCDSDRIGAKIVKFFMTAPTIYQYIWRAIRRTQQEVRYYHAGMILADEGQSIIEQQGKVQMGSLEKILSRRITIYRLKNITSSQQAMIKLRAIGDLGKGYGVGLVIGKFLTWLTGIKWFERFIGKETRNTQICWNRVARWYLNINNFGAKYTEDSTTDSADDYMRTHQDDWEVAYQNG